MHFHIQNSAFVEFCTDALCGCRKRTANSIGRKTVLSEAGPDKQRCQKIRSASKPLKEVRVPIKKPLSSDPRDFLKDLFRFLRDRSSLEPCEHKKQIRHRGWPAVTPVALVEPGKLPGCETVFISGVKGTPFMISLYFAYHFTMSQRYRAGSGFQRQIRRYPRRCRCQGCTLQGSRKDVRQGWPHT